MNNVLRCLYCLECSDKVKLAAYLYARGCAKSREGVKMNDGITGMPSQEAPVSPQGM